MVLVINQEPTHIGLNVRSYLLEQHFINFERYIHKEKTVSAFLFETTYIYQWWIFVLCTSEAVKQKFTIGIFPGGALQSSYEIPDNIRSSIILPRYLYPSTFTYYVVSNQPGVKI